MDSGFFISGKGGINSQDLILRKNSILTSYLNKCVNLRKCAMVHYISDNHVWFRFSTSLDENIALMFLRRRLL